MELTIHEKVPRGYLSSMEGVLFINITKTRGIGKIEKTNAYTELPPEALLLFSTSNIVVTKYELESVLKSTNADALKTLFRLDDIL